MAPKRIQRKRTKGWRMPEGAVYVGRPGRWGNPLQIEKLPTPLFPAGSWGVRDLNYRIDIPMELRVFDDKHLAAVFVTRLFELHTGPMGNYEYDADTLAELRRDLAGKDLACWCPLSSPCHGDILLEIANGGPGECP